MTQLQPWHTTRADRAAMLRSLLVPPALCALAVSVLAAALLLPGR